ncbi:MAG: hypothetical protein ACRCZZ_06335 [Phocaeicola sp.]
MKANKLMIYAFSALMLSGATACSNNDISNGNGGNGTEDSYAFGTDGGHTSCSHLLFDKQGHPAPSGNYIGNGDQNFVFKGTQTLTKGTYILKGWVYVGEGSTLTIEPGTIIKGDKETQAALIVERGGKLIAKGDEKNPIVFTSEEPKGNRKPGDWGGLIICGKAPNNQNEMQIEGGPRTKHGGNNPTDNSGILSYVRVEFAGYPFKTNQEINGITFGSVGSGTQIDHIQVSYCNDDSYEWFGGTVDAKYLIAYKGWDDDFDTDNGFCGNIQYGLIIRDPKMADTSRSNAFESDNSSDGAKIEPYTTATFSNITIVGPVGRNEFTNTTDYITGGSYNPNNGSALGLYQSAIQLRRNSRLNLFNSVAIGFPIGLILDGQRGNTPGAANDGILKLENIWFAGMTITGSDANGKYEDVFVTEYNSEGKPSYDTSRESNSTTFFLTQTGNEVKTMSEIDFKDGHNIGVEYMPNTGSPVLNAASFSDSKLSRFEQVEYIGAFHANDNWLNGWTNFDPNNTEY